MHVRKFPANDCKHMLKHFEQHSANNKIYNLAPDRGNQYEYMINRCKEANALKRKDLITMCCIDVIMPDDLPENISEQSFFQAVYNHFSKKFGEENVISCYVHKENNKLPHCHFAFVPACPNDRGKITVSGKRLISRQALRSLHPEAEAAISKELGQKIHLLMDNAIRSDTNTLQHKEYIQLQRKIEAAQKELADLQKQIEETERKLKGRKDNI